MQPGYRQPHHIGYLYSTKSHSLIGDLNLMFSDLTVSNDLNVGSDLTVSNDLTVNGTAYANEFKKKNGGSLTSLIDDFSNDWLQLGQDIPGVDGVDYFGFSVAINSDGTVVVFGVFELYTTGSARVYKWDGSSWNMLGTEGELDGNNGDRTGRSVAISGDGTIVAVGAFYHSKGPQSREGTVRVYHWDGSTWTMLGAAGDLDGQVGDQVDSVALSGDGTILAVGAPNHDSGKGIVRVSIGWF